MSETSQAPRSRILLSVERAPGLHLRELARRTDLSLGTVRYHLGRLEAQEAVVHENVGGFVRWFPGRGLAPTDRVLISALRVHTQRVVVQALLARSSARFSELQAWAAVSPSTLSRNLRRLILSGLIVRGSEGAYHLSDPTSIRESLARYRKRSPDFLADAAIEVFGGLE